MRHKVPCREVTRRRFEDDPEALAYCEWAWRERDNYDAEHPEMMQRDGA